MILQYANQLQDFKYTKLVHSSKLNFYIQNKNLFLLYIQIKLTLHE